MRGQRASEPLQALRVRDRVGRDERDVLELGAGAGDEDEVDRDEVLPDDPQPGHRGEGVLRRGDAAVDGVLDRDHGGIRPALDDVRERLADVAHRAPLLAARLGHLREGRLGERAGRPQVAVGAAHGGSSGVGRHADSLASPPRLQPRVEPTGRTRSLAVPVPSRGKGDGCQIAAPVPDWDP